MGYRKDIQILRGIAVLAVLLYHLGVPGFASGFLGVDIFFVVSGYLMATLYRPGEAKNFFNKRAKRLLPSYYLTIFLVLVVSAFFVAPHEYKSVVDQGRWSAAFMPNIGFWIENSYFSKTAFKPLLHLWSLGVEIQFYLLVPLFALILNRSKAAVLILLIASMLACFVIADISSKTAFFWLPTRLWEFLAGFYLAALPAIERPIKNRLGPTVSAILLLLLSYALASQISGEDTGFVRGHPGFSALTVALTTAGIIYFGLPEIINSSKVGTWLEKLGDYSYEIYLVHFPVIVLVLYQPFAGTRLAPETMAEWAAILVLTAVLSVLINHYFSQPLRKRDLNYKHAIIASAVIAASIVPAKVINARSVSDREQRIYNAWEDRSVYRCGKIFRVAHPFSSICEITNKLELPIARTILIGNSHADSIKTAFAKAAEQQGVSAYFNVENNPLLEGGSTPNALIDTMLGTGINSAVLHFSPQTKNFDNLERFLSLAENASISVSFIEPVPVWEKHIPKALIENLPGSSTLPKQTLAEYTAYNAELRQWLDKNKHRLMAIYPVSNLLCSPDCAYISDQGRPLYFDSGHLTLTGSRVLTPVFEKVISDLQKKKAPTNGAFKGFTEQ